MGQTRRKPGIIFSFMSIGHYRREPMNLIIEHFGDDLEIFAGEFAIDRSIRTLGPSQLRMSTLSTQTFMRGRIFFQRIPWLTYLRVPVLVADLNPRVVHLWPILAVRRLLRKPTILWGHAWPRKGRHSKTAGIRLTMVRLASGVITYTYQQARELQPLLPNVKVYTAPNSLYSSAKFGFSSELSRSKFVYVGRVVEEKKVALMVHAFARAHSRLEDVSLVIVGDGPAMPEIKRIVEQFGLAGRVEFLGHVDDPETLRSIYSHGIATISPGYVGLSATQSFSFGVPMIVADNEPHSPEIEAVKPGFNSLLFESGSIDSLADAMTEMASNRIRWMGNGPAIAEECRRTYSAEAMAAGVIEAVTMASGESCEVR